MLHRIVFLSIVSIACSSPTPPPAGEVIPEGVDRPREAGETVRTLRQKRPPVGPTRVQVSVVRIEACPPCAPGATCSCRPALVVSDSVGSIAVDAPLDADDLRVWVKSVERFEVGARWDMTISLTGPDSGLLVSGSPRPE